MNHCTIYLSAAAADPQSWRLELEQHQLQCSHVRQRLWEAAFLPALFPRCLYLMSSNSEQKAKESCKPRAAIQWQQMCLPSIIRHAHGKKVYSDNLSYASCIALETFALPISFSWVWTLTTISVSPRKKVTDASEMHN